MNLYFAADHGGFHLKQYLLDCFANEPTIVVKDLGAFSLDNDDDYPSYAVEVANAVINDRGSYGVLICRSGQGMCIAANKVASIRAALVQDPENAQHARMDNDAQIICLPSDSISNENALATVKAFISTAFSNEPRHLRRLEKLHEIDGGMYGN